MAIEVKCLSVSYSRRLQKRLKYGCQRFLDFFQVTKKRSAWVILYHPLTHRILLNKRSRRVNNAGLWDFLGGTIERGEGPISTAIRESFEEGRVRIAWKNIQECGRIRISNRTIYYFMVYVASHGEPDLNNEHSKHRWTTLEQIVAMKKLHTSTVVIVEELVARGRTWQP